MIFLNEVAVEITAMTKSQPANVQKESMFAQLVITYLCRHACVCTFICNIHSFAISKIRSLGGLSRKTNPR